MLRIGVVRWRGKCASHPRFDPRLDCDGAKEGGCPKCATLAEIYEHHQKMVSLMRKFPPAAAPKRPKPNDRSHQTSFFDDLAH